MIYRIALFMTVFFTACFFATASANEPMKPNPKPLRICFLGDSITDGDTYPRLVETAMRRDGFTVVSINAGYGGNKASDMLARIEKDVLANKPDIVTVSAGANDCMHNVTPADFEKNLRLIVETLRKADVTVILLTPCGLSGEAKEKGEALLIEYNGIIRKLSMELGVRLADVYPIHRKALKAGEPVMDTDGLHPGTLGQKLIARAILDALGKDKLPVPDSPDITESPGLIKSWKIHALDGKNLSADEMLSLKPDASWKSIDVPSPGPADQYWLEHNRQLGVVVGLSKLAGAKGPFVGAASIESDEAKEMRFHTGAELQKIWLNGELIYDGQWNGWHPGRFSVTGKMKAGTNQIMIQTGDTFFLSMTEGSFWP